MLTSTSVVSIDSDALIPPAGGNTPLLGQAIGAMFKPTLTPAEMGYSQFPVLDTGRVPTEPLPTTPPGTGWQDDYDLEIKGFKIRFTSADWVYNVNKGNS